MRSSLITSCHCERSEAISGPKWLNLQRTRDRVPLDWAQTQNTLAARWRRWASGTPHLTEAVAAYRLALEEWRRDRVPITAPRRQVLDWRDRLVCSGCGSRPVEFGVTGTERPRIPPGWRHSVLSQRPRRSLALAGIKPLGDDALDRLGPWFRSFP
jgi:hypothetical protein